MVKLSFIVAMAAALLSLVAATIDPKGASGFIAPGSFLTFAVNFPDDGTNDLYFSLSARSNLSWAAVGMGSDQMVNSLVFIMYQDSTGNNITLSPRLATQLAEPVYSPAINLSLLSGTGISGDTMLANAVCHNCRSWSLGSINTNNTDSPFIFARGPYQSFRSNSVTASIMIHEEFGSFAMNLSQAVGPAQIPSTTGSDIGQATSDSVSESLYPTLMHGYLMFTGLVIVMPSGSWASRCLPRSTLAHSITETLAVMLALAGFYYGMVVSCLYVRSEGFHSFHQLFGFLITTITVCQAVLGFNIHRIRAHERPSLNYVPFHTWVGRFLIVAGIVNSFLGLQLSYHLAQLALYFGIVAAIWVIFEVSAFILWVSKRMQRQRHQDEEARS